MIAVDLFSDTVTRPTPAMRRAMAEAEVGDEQLGKIPRSAGSKTGWPRSWARRPPCSCPPGTMGNQVAFAVHCRPGDEILLHELPTPCSTRPAAPAR